MHRDSVLHRWASCLREDLASGPYVRLRPDFVPPSPFLVVKDDVAKTSQVLVEPHLIEAQFRKAWMPFFCRSGRWSLFSSGAGSLGGGPGHKVYGGRFGWVSLELDQDTAPCLVLWSGYSS